MAAAISGDGIFSHVMIGATHLKAAEKFYDAALAPLGLKNLGPFGDNWILYGKDKPAFLIARPGNGQAASSNGATIGFATKSTADVDAFHKAGAAAGGKDEGAPPASATTCRAPTPPTSPIRPGTRSARTPSPSRAAYLFSRNTR